jgi:hypothetical protein
VTIIVCQPEDLLCPEVRFGQQAYIDAMLAEELIQFLLPAADTVSIPANQPQGFVHLVRVGRAAIIGYK